MTIIENNNLFIQFDELAIGDVFKWYDDSRRTIGDNLYLKTGFGNTKHNAFNLTDNRLESIGFAHNDKVVKMQAELHVG